MMAYSWPGNVRELENTLTRAAVLARSDTITPDLLALPTEMSTDNQLGQESNDELPLRLVSINILEKEHINNILEHTRWHKGKACKILGISRPALDRKIVKYELK